MAPFTPIVLSRFLAVGAALAVTATGLAAPAAAAPIPSPGAAPQKQAPLANPDKALGKNWRSSTDVVIAGAGDTSGYHLYIAREKDAFAWSTLATLTSSDVDAGPWGGAVCVTGSGRYAVAVFAPKALANRPRMAMSGALAAVVDISTGKAVHVASGVQLSYFNPACGPDDTALLTRMIGDDAEVTTDVLTVNAAAGRVVKTRHVATQLTNPAPAPDGDYGVAGGNLVKIGATGKLTRVAKLAGRAFGVRATANSGVDVVSVSGETAVAERFQNGKLARTATGPWNRVQLFGLAGGKNVLVGNVSLKAGVKELSSRAEDRQITTVSQQGRLLAEEVYSQQTADSADHPLASADPAHAGKAHAAVRAAASGQEALATITTSALAPVLDVKLAATSSVQTVTAAAAPASVTTPSCAVPRNDPTVQPLQPSPNQVEWAVDNAVHGKLMTTRPANYLKTGLPAYSPQSMFELHKINGGSSTVPANLMLAILAQETNLAQASWHAVPGDSGNPLLPLYYGSYDTNVINYAASDCGYGIGQVTTGMTVAAGTSVYTKNQQKAIAVDYAANIAASINILIDKFNQISAESGVALTQINDNDPRYIENWFLAVWAYNSGYYPHASRSSNGGRYGVGWLNNPANTTYRANREGFMRDDLADAETPSDWSYPERIMGWVETPQYQGDGPSYSEPAYGTNATHFDRLSWRDLELHHPGVSLPGLYTFCSPEVNSCSEAQDGCPAVSSACWWHGTATVGEFDCNGDECTQEKLSYGLGSSEPDLQRIYPLDCDFASSVADRVDGWDHVSRPAVIHTLNNPNQYNLGCDEYMWTQDGKFRILAGNPAGATDDAYYADIDLHQLGTGYNGHIWFTHGVSGSALAKHEVRGMWSPDLDIEPGFTERYDILIHIPSHGADATNATYNLQLGSREDWENSAPQQCVINQADHKSQWVFFGNYELGRGARLWLSNAGVSSSVDVGYDAVMFLPMGETVTTPGCGEVLYRN